MNPLRSKLAWFRRMAKRLRSLIDQPSSHVTIDQALDLMANAAGKLDWAEFEAFTLDDSHIVIRAGFFERLVAGIYQRFQIRMDPIGLLTALLTPGDPVEGKLRKQGPFSVARLLPEYPWFAHVLANAIEQIRDLPDFSDDKNIMVMSDFGGEHGKALFNTYSFAFFAQDKSELFQRGVNHLRERHGYNEISYKRLDSGPSSRALPDFLELVDQYVHGVIITIAIDKDIPTLFGSNKHETHAFMVKQLEELGFGKWKGPLAEKAARVCHSLAIFSSLLAVDDQVLLWYCDNDAINTDGKHRSFSHLQEMSKVILSMYATQKLNILGFAKSFETKSYLDDMLSLADLAAGAVQDLLHMDETAEVIPGGDEKMRVMKWMASKSPFLSKINLLITKQSDGTVVSGLVSLSPTQALRNYDWSGAGVSGVVV